MDDKEQAEQYRKAVNQAKALQDEIDQTYRDLLSVPRGRLFLWHLLQIGKFGIQPYTNNALATSFNCGELNVGMQIFNEINNVDPAGFMRMQQEQINAGRSDTD